MLSVKLLNDCDQTIEEDMKRGVNFFSECFNVLLDRGQGSIEWRKHREDFISFFTKLVTDSTDVIEHANTTYALLGEYLQNAMQHGDYPDTLEASSAHNNNSKPQRNRRRNRSHKKEEEQEEEKKSTPVEEPEEAQPE